MSKATSWDARFAPSFTLKEMLEMGVFEGKYINNLSDIPDSWHRFSTVLQSSDDPDPSLNYFEVKSRLSLPEWRQRGWIRTDENGWFHWYIRYWQGRRLGEEDDWQIGRWKSFVARHQGQIAANCQFTDLSCRPRQRQGLLQWGWDSSTPWNEDQRKKNLEKIQRRTPSRISVEMELPPSLRW